MVGRRRSRGSRRSRRKRKTPQEHTVSSHIRHVHGKIIHVKSHKRGKGQKRETRNVFTKRIISISPRQTKGYSSKKITEMAVNHPFIAVYENKVTETFNYKGHPVAIIDTFQFGGIWSPKDKLIMFDKKSWSKLNKTERKIVLEHEINERNLAIPHYSKYRSHAQAVAAWHDKSNDILYKKYGKTDVETAIRKCE